jgi:hypothetical protein
MDFALTVLPLLVFLACPFMMLFCVVGMRKMECSTPRTTAGQAAEAGITPHHQLTAVQSQLAEAQCSSDRLPRTIRPETASTLQVTHVARQPARP